MISSILHRALNWPGLAAGDNEARRLRAKKHIIRNTVGLEIDIRVGLTNALVISHDNPFDQEKLNQPLLEKYLWSLNEYLPDNYAIMLNVKESGLVPYIREEIFRYPTKFRYILFDIPGPEWEAYVELCHTISHRHSRQLTYLARFSAYETAPRLDKYETCRMGTYLDQLLSYDEQQDIYLAVETNEEAARIMCKVMLQKIPNLPGRIFMSDPVLWLHYDEIREVFLKRDLHIYYRELSPFVLTKRPKTWSRL